ncbi:hypothetical protein [Arthrobacter oryzae]|uniref:hypothetical protein n=1 Tax=Arthrobacter oryzae TaxID=409290 RepID=UPI000EB5BF6A|nr:hypothetical protein [Arthrobacter oryzae]
MTGEFDADCFNCGRSAKHDPWAIMSRELPGISSRSEFDLFCTLLLDAESPTLRVNGAYPKFSGSTIILEFLDTGGIVFNDRRFELPMKVSFFATA